MRVALLIFFLLGCSWASAQNDRLRFDQPFVTKAFDPTSGDISAVNRVFNATSRPVRARWVREVIEMPRGWNLAISDGAQESGYRVDSADFVIDAYGSAPIAPHVAAGLGEGNVQVTVRVFEIQNRRNYALSTFRFEQQAAAPAQVLKLYPNPGDDEFRISSTTALARVTVTNMLGKVVKTFHGHNDTYDVSELPNGIYLVGLTGLDGRVIKTLRFSKRSVRP